MSDGRTIAAVIATDSSVVASAYATSSGYESEEVGTGTGTGWNRK